MDGSKTESGFNNMGVETDIKAAAAVATATTSTGTASLLDWLPEAVATMAAFVGLCLSVVLIVTHVRRTRNERRQANVKYERTKLELEIMQKREAERTASAD